MRGGRVAVPWRWAIVVAGLLAAPALAGEQKGEVYEHKGFSLLLPEGWRAVAKPERPDLVTFIDGGSPQALMVVILKPLTPLQRTLAGTEEGRVAMAKGFRAALEKGFPDAKDRELPKRAFPGTPLAHIATDVTFKGKPYALEQAAFAVEATLHNVQIYTPRAREQDVAPVVAALIESYKPKQPAAKPGTAATP